ncbi:transient receptor potential cation channel trpm [Thrips palmi]|uniref:Transient receptor potential cation channel trpm n=1 Tax=Thrips palmi TaxID=161013 RepID=A0A6P8YY64_THRPL|nr:transient receptor potential cation channel trpm [Thrips palmi]
MRSKKKKVETTARSWVEASFQKRECVKFIPNAKDDYRCCCGLPPDQHRAGTSLGGGSESPSEQWSPARCTVAAPTDAYGTVEFQGGPHSLKAQYVRLAHDTRPDQILQLFTREWTLELPKLLITVHGGKANFELQPRLKKVLRKGLLRAAKTTGAWIFTSGTNTGVTRQVGDALVSERAQRGPGRVVSIGIAPWGIVEGHSELVARGREVPYHAIASPRSRMAVLNSRHAYFLMVDNGTQGRYGAEVVLRRKLEKYISMQKLNPSTHCSTPVVCLVIEGGTNTIRAVLEYVTDSPPVPVVVCDGSGRAADLIAFTHKYASESGEQTVLENMKEYLITTIMRIFEVGPEKAEGLYQELLACTRKKHLITVFRMSDRQDAPQELDQTILTALFKSQHLSPSEQLQLALTWNRVDIARSEIFVYGQEWPPGALEEAMMQALEHDRLDFVKLLLENGVSMRKFLTIPRLEELYNSKNGPSNTLGYILRDVRPHIPRGYVYTLHDIGLVINKLMGGAYRAQYTRRKFRMIYTKVMKKSPHVQRNSSSFIRYVGNQNATLSLLAETLPSSPDMPYFDHPFNELLTWAVLTKRQHMALLMWQHGEEALAKALVAAKLYKAMAHEAAEDDLEAEIYEELRSYGKEFENIALELLDYCYRQDDDQTQKLLTCELQNWSGQTCLSLAVSANHRALLAHPCSQIILADLWMGGLRTRKNTNLKVILGLLCPAYIPQLEFKSREELQLMPQTEEEHQLGLEEEEEESVEGGLTNKRAGDGQHRNTEPDIEKKAISRMLSMKAKQALLVPPPIVKSKIKKKVLIMEPRDSLVQENGKVVLDDGQSNPLLQFPMDFYDLKKEERPLKLEKKLYEFYTAPISKFWGHSIAYMVFLYTFSYVVLVRMPAMPTWPELYVIGYVTAFGCEKVRELLSAEPVGLRHKLAVWAWNMWNPCDVVVVVFFLVGLVLRLQAALMSVGRLLFCVDIIYWYLRIFTILSVNKYLGPLVTMMDKMVKNMIYFVVLLLVVLISFGVCRQAILYPDNEASWDLIKDIFFQPYFMLYGEVFADAIDPPCGDGPDMKPCRVGRWVSPVVMSLYLLVANILLINLLIAVFNNIFNEVNAISHQVWMFQRFTVVMEYEQKPVLPPPFILFSHLYMLAQFVLRKLRGQRSETYDNGLKLFLENDDLERLHDFEEECVEGYFREKDAKLLSSMEERVRTINERVDHISQKVEDVVQKETAHASTYQNIEFHLRKLEELSDQTVSHLGVIHRFMATQGRDAPSAQAPFPFPFPFANMTGSSQDVQSQSVGLATAGLQGSPVVPDSNRFRRFSERSELEGQPSGPGRSETSGSATELASPGPPFPRRRPVRSWTEVRPERSDNVFEQQAKPCVLMEEGQEDSTESDLDDVADVADVPITGSLSTSITSPPGSVPGPLPGICAVGPGLRYGGHPHPQRVRRASETEWGKRTRGRERSQSLGGDDLDKNMESDLETRFMRTQSQSEGSALPPSYFQTRRQLSQTHSEPEGYAVGSGVLLAASGTMGTAGSASRISGSSRDGDRDVAPRCMVLPTARATLRAMHTEYTSITDELETVCGLLSPSRTEHLSLGEAAQRVRHASEMSNPEMAMFLEKETLRDAEESDYQLMSDLIQHRYNPNDHTSQLDRERFGNNAFFLTVTDETALERPSASDSQDKGSGPSGRPLAPLVRATAVEGVQGEATPETLTPLSSPVASSSPAVSSPLTPTTTAIVHKAPAGKPGQAGKAPLAVPQSSTSSTSSSSVSSIPYGNTETLC